MPSLQRGSVVKKNGRWQARWYDADGNRRSRSGFATKTAAREWLDDQVKEVSALRRGVLLPAHRPQTVNELLDVFVDKHGHTLDPQTLRIDKSSLNHARNAFGDRPPRLAQPARAGGLAARDRRGFPASHIPAAPAGAAMGVARSLVTRDASGGSRIRSCAGTNGATFSRSSRGTRSRRSPRSCIRGSARSRSSPSVAACGRRSSPVCTAPTSTGRTDCFGSSGATPTDC